MEAPGCAGYMRLMSIFVLAAVLLPLFCSMGEASWPDDPAVNLSVCVTAQMQSRPNSISDGAGGIIVVWQDYRNLYFDIYAQRIAADGTAMWGVNGVSVCSAAGEQEFPEIVFLFSGSQKSMMREIFTDANRPFFQSTQMMELHEIELGVYEKEVFQILDSIQKKYDPLVIRQVLTDTYCHTGFTQMVLSRIFSESENKIDFPLHEQIWSDILANYKSMAREQEFLLPPKEQQAEIERILQPLSQKAQIRSTTPSVAL